MKANSTLTAPPSQCRVPQIAPRPRLIARLTDFATARLSATNYRR